VSEIPANRPFQPTRANGRERLRALATQKVEGSSPFIRFEKTFEAAVSRDNLLTRQHSVECAAVRWLPPPLPSVTRP
jgi:hypothetical protein